MRRCRSPETSAASLGHLGALTLVMSTPNVHVITMTGNASTNEMISRLSLLLGEDKVRSGNGISEAYSHDEALTATPQIPKAVIFVESTADVIAVVRLADELSVPITARGSGTGLSGGAIPHESGVVVSFERMTNVLEIDKVNNVAVVEPGVTLGALDEVLAGHGLVYPVFPGELSGSIGGNVATNAGGMRAVKYGVTRHQVLGLEFVLATGEVIRSGGKYVKSSSGYDLTQLVIGSEGTLALVTEVTVRVYPRPKYSKTMLVPFLHIEDISSSIPAILANGTTPLVLEYIDTLGLSAMSTKVGLNLGVSPKIKESATAYLFIILEEMDLQTLEAETTSLSQLLFSCGALEVYLLPEPSAAKLLEAREAAFWVSKEHGANDIVDVVIPRSEIPRYLNEAQRIAQTSATFISGVGHVGDGNVHFSIYQPDPKLRDKVVMELLHLGLTLGGSISAEHGIGSEKRKYLSQLEDPNKLELMRRIKQAFDPKGILNPEKVI